MGRPIFIEVLDKPCTSAVCIVLVAIWAWLSHKHLSYADVGFKYDLVVAHQQWMRLPASICSHIDIIHLLWNITGLWSLGYAETLLGSAHYLIITLLLIVVSSAVTVVLYYIAINWFKQEHMSRLYCVGYSGVLFGWMAELSIRNPGGVSSLSLLGLISVPLYLAPFGSLILTSLLIPQASFVGHLAGILAGYAIALTGLDNTGPLGAAVVVAWLAIGTLWMAVKHHWSFPPFVTITYPSAPADVETGAAGLAVRLIAPLSPPSHAVGAH